MGSESYSLKEIAKRLGVPQRVVLQWEEAYPEWIICRKSDAGEKSYGRDALTALERVKNLVYRCGYAPEDVTAALRKSDLPRYDPLTTEAGAASPESSRGFSSLHDHEPASPPRTAGAHGYSVLTSHYATSPYSSVSALVQQSAVGTLTPPERTPFRTKPAEPFALHPRPPMFTEAPAASPVPAEASAEQKEPPARGKAFVGVARKPDPVETSAPAITDGTIKAAVRAAALEAGSIREGLSRLLGGVA